MTFSIGQTSQNSQSSAVDSKADQLIARSRRGTLAASPSGEDAKIAKAGKDFESILLGSWLQQAQQSFATVPGGDGQGDDDSGKDQFQGIAMQALAGSLTASGGIGIAKMITKHLSGTSSHEAAISPDSANGKKS